MGSAPATVLAQDSYSAAMKAGRGAYGQSDMATAQRHFEDALKTAENERQKASAHYALGVVSQKQNKIAEAKQHAERALAINPADKQAKGLLDEVNAAPVVPAKKGGTKGLAKTPLAPGGKTASGHKATAGAATGSPAAASPVSKTPKPVPKAAVAPASGPAAGGTGTTRSPTVAPPVAKVPVATSPTAKGPASAAPATTSTASPPAAVAPVSKKSPARLPSATQPPAADPDVQPRSPQPPGKSGALPGALSGAVLSALPATMLPDDRGGDDRKAQSRPGSAHVATAESEGTVAAARASEPATAIVTGSIAGASPAVEFVATAAAAPASSAALLTKAAPDAVPLPARARFVEMTCGLDHRQEGRTVARGLEITRAPDTGDTGDTGNTGEIVTFELACEKAGDGRPAPRALMKAAQADIVRSPIRTAPEGGWSYWHHRSQRLIRLRLEGDDLIVVPSAAEVAVLRRKLAENPAQLEAMPPEIRRNFELVVTGDGYPEFRRLRDTDQLDAVFDAAAKVARRAEQTAGDARAAASVRP